MNIEPLKAELSGDPLGVGYSNMTAEEAATSLNTESRKRYRPISGAMLLRWSAAGASETSLSRIVRIKLASELKAPFDGVGYVAQGYAAASVAAIASQVPLSYDEAAIRGMVAALSQAGVLTAGEVSELDALGTELISRGEELGIGRVKPGHVEQARAV